MNKKETIILIAILVVSLAVFTFYKLGYLQFYLSKDSVYAQIVEIKDDYVVLKSLNKSGGLTKGEEVYLTLPSNSSDLIKNLEIGKKIKFVPTKIEGSNPPKLSTDSIEVIN